MDEEEEDIELQIDILKAQLNWDWRLTWIVIAVGILVTIAVLEDLPSELRKAILGLITATILLTLSFWSDWPDNKAKELREKYLKNRDQNKEID